MEKTVVFPGVVIYKNLLEDVKEIHEYLEKTTSYTETKHLMNPWSEWFGNWKGLALQANGIQWKPIEGEDEDAIQQRKMFANILKAYSFSYKDFMNDYKESLEWPAFIKNWDLENPIWCESGISFLRYDDKNAESIDRNTWDIAMNYHTDTNLYDTSSPGTKIAITVTMYLNDGYDGGEISFFSEKEKKVYDYKPVAGDVTVFPGFSPYYHGVLPFKNDNRYLLRMFLMYDHPGDQEWHYNQEKYGKEEWAKMEHDKLEDLWKKGANLRSLVLPGQDPSFAPFAAIKVDEQPIRIF